MKAISQETARELLEALNMLMDNLEGRNLLDQDKWGLKHMTEHVRAVIAKAESGK